MCRRGWAASYALVFLAVRKAPRSAVDSIVTPAARAILARTTARTSGLTGPATGFRRWRVPSSTFTCIARAPHYPAPPRRVWIMMDQGVSGAVDAVPKNPPKSMQHHLRQLLNRRGRWVILLGLGGAPVVGCRGLTLT